jgi:hypothetical protein
VHEYSATSLPFGAELTAAEEQAKKERKNVGLAEMIFADESSGPTTMERRRPLRLPRTRPPLFLPSTSMSMCRLSRSPSLSALRFRYWRTRVSLRSRSS